TMVCLGETMLGKAKNRQEAKEMLENQSGKLQTVYTAIAIFEDNQVKTYCDKADVWFKKLNTKDIEEYLDTEEWIGKAGAYAIQGIGNILVERISGDKETIIGLPVRIIESYLHSKK
ncbi:MAG: Maf family protein, partial [Coprobacillaceae bacterium]